MRCMLQSMERANKTVERHADVWLSKRDALLVRITTPLPAPSPSTATIIITSAECVSPSPPIGRM